MSLAANAYLVARHGHVMYVRATGLSNMKNAMVLEAFLNIEATSEIHTVCVDLSACSGMDSTFMGLLLASSARIRPHGGKLVVVNPTENNLKLLRLLGLADVPSRCSRVASSRSSSSSSSAAARAPATASA